VDINNYLVECNQTLHQDTSLNRRVAIGTAQFGLSYGIANIGGQLTQSNAAGILALARSAGVDTVDTAFAYGNAQQRLGELGVGDLRVVSKLPGLPSEEVDICDWVNRIFNQSLNMLRVTKIYALLLHQPSDLLSPKGVVLYGAIERLKKRGLVEKVGLSVCSTDELDAISLRFAFDLVQVPFNILDTRFENSGWLDRMRRQGIEIHARSIFLQGLLLMSPDIRAARFSPWQDVWDQWSAWLDGNDISPLAACLRYAMNERRIDRIVVGVDSLGQFQEILAALPGNMPPVPECLHCDDVDLIDPSRWSIR
jgi:aryl-alcohol dehydrogenase-like predicted oxidoreductase